MVWEEYRYDPLGRRILVRAVKEDLCEGSTFGGGQSFCQSTITRYVWSGDQVLWEMRVAGEDSADLEKTAWSSGAPNAIRFGRVSYLHAGGIDRPLAITKEAVGTVVPHQNWRGMFAWGTWATGANKGLRSDCTTGNQTGCMSLAWPGWQTSAWHEDGNPGENEYWLGSLVDGMRDASGQIYMRNRYYNPASGQFTQTDPIGLAGGMNAYGFAIGDPVSYADPYGLTWDLTGLDRNQRRQLQALRRSSTTFDRWYLAVQNSSDVFTIRNPRNANERTLVGDIGGGGWWNPRTREAIVSRDNEYRSSAMGFEELVVHEVAHAAAGLTDGTPSACNSGDHAAQEKCGMEEANKVHRELGWRERTDYEKDRGPFKPTP